MFCDSRFSVEREAETEALGTVQSSSVTQRRPPPSPTGPRDHRASASETVLVVLTIPSILFVAYHLGPLHWHEDLELSNGYWVSGSQTQSHPHFQLALSNWQYVVCHDAPGPSPTAGFTSRSHFSIISSLRGDGGATTTRNARPR